MKSFPIVVYVSKSRALIALERRRFLANTLALADKGKLYVLCLFIAFLLGLSPLIFNFIVDPYNVNKIFNLKMEKEKISLKAHYPLWKIANYPKEKSSTLILGDSRALALKDKYWQQLQFDTAYNFSYGGATIHEISDTFKYVSNNPQLKNVFIGIQLRSFSPLFKKGMNRVPEAIQLAHEPLQYYSNGFITEISWRQFENKYKNSINKFKKLVSNYGLISSAHASSGFPSEDKSLSKLLDPINCTSCILPELTSSEPAPVLLINKPNIVADLGIWQKLWPSITIDRQLPAKFASQVSKNAKSDWQSFTFSSQYWRYLVDIADICQKNNINLVFFIPPTIAELQQQITNYGYAKNNQQLREDLAQLATVVDFDFDNPLTRDIKNFNDAYHFNYKVAKQIIGELILLVNEDEKINTLVKKRRTNIKCPYDTQSISSQLTDGQVNVSIGKSCRVWRSHYE